MKSALRAWGNNPEGFDCPVHVTPHIAHSGPVYLGPDHHLVRGAHEPKGLHVATEAHRQAIEAHKAAGLRGELDG